MKRLMLCVLLAAGARPALSAPFNFDWYGRVEVEAAGLQSDDSRRNLIPGRTRFPEIAA